ncbi:hypothetical protein J2S70_001136 [Trueperella bonasi]|uniref:Uncharacterized protein n=1 Tax=Trueperella bonasi TaxID=312286 RepID=A0ABT9NGM2_9ACTO|nr:hypothetical protein [Trueperella bonasi]
MHQHVLSKRRLSFIAWGVASLLLISTIIFRDYAVFLVVVAVFLWALSLGLYISSENDRRNS